MFAHTLSPSLCAVSRCRSSSRHLKRESTLSATKRRRRDDDSTETSATTMFGGQPPRSSRQRGSKRKTRQRRALDALPPLHKCSRRSLGSGGNTCGARRRLETRVARRAGLDTNCPYGKHSWSNSWSTSPIAFLRRFKPGDVSTVAARSDLARTTTDVPMSDCLLYTSPSPRD